MKKKTIEQLIEECNGKHGQRFRWLKYHKSHFLAQARPAHKKSRAHPNSPLTFMPKDVKAKGATAREAMENLVSKLKHVENQVEKV